MEHRHPEHLRGLVCCRQEEMEMTEIHVLLDGMNKGRAGRQFGQRMRLADGQDGTIPLDPLFP